MSTKITAENGAGIEVGQLGITVVHPEGIATIWARLSQEQRRALADALVSGRDFSGVDWKVMYDQARRERDAAVYAYDKADLERDEWKARAEAAEARTAPAVTREEVEQSIRARPWRTHGVDSQGYEIIHVESAVDAVCDLLGIEAGQATDPVEELAGQIESATREAIRQVCVDLADVAPALDPLTVELAMEVTAASRKVAAHVLGRRTVMSISDRLDEIDSVAPYLDDDDMEAEVLAATAALRAVLDLCELIEKAHAANPKRTYEQGMEVAAHKVRTVIAAALGQEATHVDR